MKFSASILAATLTIAPALAQPAAPPDTRTFASSADIQALIAKAKTMPPKPNVSQPIVGSGGYSANLEYRAGPGGAAIHPKEDELISVVDGTGTVTLGGTMLTAKPGDVTGTGITGGTNIRLTKGAVMIVPAGTPHQMTPDKGVALVLMTMHMPAGTAN